MACQKLDNQIIRNSFIHSFDYVLTDCDGVLWNNNELILGAREAIQCLRDEVCIIVWCFHTDESIDVLAVRAIGQMPSACHCTNWIRSTSNLIVEKTFHLKLQGKKVIFVTNNSTKSRTEYLKKFRNLDFPASLEEIFSSAYCAALYLQSVKFDKKVYVIGSTGVTQELEQFGIKYVPTGADILPENTDVLFNPTLDSEVGAVVVGHDVHFNYYKMTKALFYLRDPRCLYLATNTDSQYPVREGVTIPGTGAIVAAVTNATGREPKVMGKPQSLMVECIQRVYKDLQLSRCLMIGDRLDTDILLGRNNGMTTLLVMSGVTQQGDLSSSPPSHLPDFYLPSLKDLCIYLQENPTS